MNKKQKNISCLLSSHPEVTAVSIFIYPYANVYECMYRQEFTYTLFSPTEMKSNVCPPNLNLYECM